MTPYEFKSWFFADEMLITSAGKITDDWAIIKYGVRPVINIDPSKIEFSGNGTMQDPYVLS